jgi:hypothetical protein
MLHFGDLAYKKNKNECLIFAAPLKLPEIWRSLKNIAV